MRKIDYVIQNLSPINFAERSTDSIFYATKRYITGSALRGALAAQYIADKKLKAAHLDEGFNKLFLSGEVRYLPAYPIGKANEDKAESFVLPPSIVQSKDGKLTYDLTISKDVGAGFKKLNGMVVSESGKYYRVNTEVQIELHMARNTDDERIKGRSIEGNIYNYEYIAARQKFKGSILANDDVADEVKQMLEKISGKVLYLGRAKNAQYGQCMFTAKSEEEESVSASMKNSGRLYLYALTPFIPYFPFQNTEEAAKQVADAINAVVGKGTVRLCDSYFSNKEEIDGYVGVWHAKRERVNAISAGSLLEIEVASDADLTKLINVLFTGLGDRISEGYGQFRVWAPMENINFEEFDVISRTVKVPEVVINKARQILKDKIMLEVKKAAMEIAFPIKRQDGQGKHIIKRIEVLMNSSLSKQAIQDEIRHNFKDTAKKNLQKIKIEGNNLFEILTESDGVKQPYASIVWKERLQLKDMTVELEKDLGTDAFVVNEDQLYRTYWLWFARHLAKKDKKQDEPFNKLEIGIEEGGGK